MPNQRREHEPILINGLYRVQLHGKSLAAVEKGGLPVYYYGYRARAEKDKSGFNCTIYLPQEGILARSYREPWHFQLEMLDDYNREIHKTHPELTFQAASKAATLVEAAMEAYKNYGVNLLPNYSRFGDGSLVAGSFDPRYGVFVHDYWDPDGLSHVGLLPVAVENRI